MNKNSSQQYSQASSSSQDVQKPKYNLQRQPAILCFSSLMPSIKSDRVFCDKDATPKFV